VGGRVEEMHPRLRMSAAMLCAALCKAGSESWGASKDRTSCGVKDSACSARKGGW
jgi:hypothetical protein